MKTIILILSVFVCFGLVFAYEGRTDWDDNPFWIDSGIAELQIITYDAAHALEICNLDKCATIDFRGDSIVYSGELEVSESAKVFFEYFGELCGK